MTRTILLVNGERVQAFDTREAAADRQRELIANAEVDPSSGGDIRHVPEWYTTEDYDGLTTYWSTPGKDVDVYLEDLREHDRDDHDYAVGVFDQTIAAHPTMPNTRAEFNGSGDALAHLFSVVQHLDEHIMTFRASDDYQRALEVKERAPATREEGGVVPGFEVRNREGRVFAGDRSVDEVVKELREIEARRDGEPER